MAAFGPVSAGLSFVRSAALLFIGNSIARLLGLLFSVAAARLLLPVHYGLMAYGIAIAGIGSILILNAPTGMGRFLALHHDDRHEQEADFSNWLAVVAGLLGASLVLVVPLALVARLGGWMLLGLIANLVGVAAFETYRGAQRGLGHFAAMALFYVSANALQLAGILLAAALGWRNPALFLTIYGLSSVAALALVQPFAPIPLRIVPKAIDRMRVLTATRFVRPLLLQTIFFTVWSGADLILVQRLLWPGASGNYAAARTLSNALWLAPSAIASVLFAQITRYSGPALRRYLLSVLGLTIAVTAPLLLGVAIFAQPLTLLIFGSKYPQAAQPLILLSVAVALYGLYQVLESAWVALGRPQIDALATGSAMVCTIITGLVLIPPHGLIGAAIAFASGALAQLAVIGTFTARELLAPTSPHPGARPDSEAESRARAHS